MLGLVEGSVDAGNELFEGFVGARLAHAYAGSDSPHRGELPGTERFAQRPAVALGFLQPCFGRENRELLAAPSTDRVRLALP